MPHIGELQAGQAELTKTVAAGGGGGGGATDLAYTAGATGGTVTSSTGTDATLTLADGTNAGLMAPAQHTKLAGIATGATANSADATLLDRANHTGTQTAATISDFSTAADARIAAASINALSDVTVTTPSTGQVLKWNGSAWVNDADATGGGGSATIAAATVSVPYGSRDYLATVTDAGVSGASKIMLLPGFYASTDENEPAEADMTLEAAASGNFLVRLTAKGRESIGGVFKLQYLIG